MRPLAVSVALALLLLAAPGPSMGQDAPPDPAPSTANATQAGGQEKAQDPAAPTDAPTPAKADAGTPGAATALSPGVERRGTGETPSIRIKNPDLFEKSLRSTQQALAFYGRLERPAELARVNRIGYAVAAQSGYVDVPFTFHLIDMPEPNALALPGGHIFLTRGMLDLGLDDDMMACLLGHEIAHVVHQHGVRLERRATLINLLSQIALIGAIAASDGRSSRDNPAPIYDPYGYERYDTGSDVITGAYAASMILGELLLRSYNREFEDESDEEGQRWAAAAGFDPRGTEKLMGLMRDRIPESREYGYWRTHPFFADRVSAASARAGYLTQREVREADAFREATQTALLDWLANNPPKPSKEEREQAERQGDRPGERPGERPPPPNRGPRFKHPLEPLPVLVKNQALDAYPLGLVAADIRLERLHALRDQELARPELARDYGRLVRRYGDEIAEVSSREPEAPLLATLRGERDALESEATALLPKARAVLEAGVFETGFLETFLSNFPAAPERARVSLLLGEAYSRLGRQADAVSQFLATWEAAPESEEAQRAQNGLRASAPYLDRLAALEELAVQDRDGELARLAEERLGKLAGTYGDIADGADYLERFPAGRQAPVVTERQEVLAKQLFGEIILYQSVGDHLKALERIQKIFEHAPLSQAATQLRERMLQQAQESQRG
jgi:Zn-dependent protease with chaperone function/tetratricopeptide (TPR) repeat protein